MRDLRIWFMLGAAHLWLPTCLPIYNKLKRNYNKKREPDASFESCYIFAPADLKSGPGHPVYKCFERFSRASATLKNRPWCTVRSSISVNGQINGFARATEIPISFVIWFSWKFRSWMVLFGSLLDQFVSSLARANVLSIFKIDADWFLDFSARILINGFNGLETLFCL
jgi:hypothetical protein